MTGDAREFGLGENILRRDFLNGVAIAIGGAMAGSLLPSLAEAAERFPQDVPGYYPPNLTGMRGSHPGSFESAHALRDGNFWARASRPKDTAEAYDLIVVGAGLSGLAAAYFYRKHNPSARVLILDNHDDFGGHAKRNEFHTRGRLLLANGGTWAIESPLPYSQVARGLLAELGIDPPALAAQDDHWEYYKGLGTATFFDKETFGVDRLVAGYPENETGAPKPPPRSAWKSFLQKSPLSHVAQRDVLRLETAAADYMPGMSSDQKKDRLSRMSYKKFLLEYVKVGSGVIPFYQTRTHDLFGVGIDAVSALDCWGLGFPGFGGMGLTNKPYHRMGFTAKGYATPGQEPYSFHFPDGNASIARMLVRRLIPGVLQGHTADDIVTAKADYSKLDRPGSPVRMRLGSTVVRARHFGAPSSANEVELFYARENRIYTVKTNSVVMAGWNMVIPYVIPDLPAPQKQALRYGSKIPLVYTVVAVRNWHVFAKLGIRRIMTPGMFHVSIRLDNPVDIGNYRSSRSASEPVLLRMVRTPCSPGLSERDQHRVGRAELLNEPFSTFEHSIRDQLARVLGPAGFDPERDIDAITVNRWSHGYAYEYNPLWDPDSFFEGGVTPIQIARKRFGRIAIANSDAAAAAYTDQAIDQGYRAVQELLSGDGV